MSKLIVNPMTTMFENKEIRTVSVDNKVYFVAKDVAETLAYKDTPKAIKAHCKKIYNLGDIVKDSKVGVLPTLKESLKLGNSWKQTSLIMQNDIVRLVTRSKLPQAQKFESWVFDEVLPSVLENGYYTNPNLLAEKDHKIAELQSKLDTTNNLELVQRQLINHDKIAQLKESKSFGILRRSTIATNGNLDDLYQQIEQPLKRAIGEEHQLYTNAINQEHKMAESYIFHLNESTNIKIKKLHTAIDALNDIWLTDSSREAINEMEVELKRLHSYKREQKVIAVDTYKMRKESYREHYNHKVKELEAYHSYDIQEKKRIAKERLDLQFVMYDKIIKNEITLVEAIQFFSEDFKIKDLPFTPQPQLECDFNTNIEL